MGMVMYLREASPSIIAKVGDNVDLAEAFVFGEEDGAEPVDFDKAWQALHFLLTGDAYMSDSPLDVIAGDASTIGQDTVERSPAWRITPERMAAFNAALVETSDAEIEARYNLDAMLANDIYVAETFDGLEPAEALEYIMQGLPCLRSLAASCAAKGYGALRVLA